MKMAWLRRVTLLQLVVHLAGWLPLLWLIYQFATNQLTANPIQALEQQTGVRALQFLVASLACTPLSRVLGWTELIQRRKALGNYGFLYAAVHAATFIALDYGLQLKIALREIISRPALVLGMAAFGLLLPLAVTSFKYWMKRLGKSWKTLHRLVYVISPLVVLHFLLVRKSNILQMSGDIDQPLLYGSMVLLLLILRLRPVAQPLIHFRKWLQNVRQVRERRAKSN